MLAPALSTLLPIAESLDRVAAGGAPEDLLIDGVPVHVGPLPAGSPPPSSPVPGLAWINAQDAGGGVLRVTWDYTGVADAVEVEIGDSSAPASWWTAAYVDYPVASIDLTVSTGMTYDVRGRARVGAEWSGWTETDAVAVL